MSDIATITTNLEHVLTKALQEEWTAQGHAMNSKIITDMEYVVKQEVNQLTISGMIYPYGNIIAAGVMASKIPFSAPSKRGGTSLYIKALQEYVKLRMHISDEKKSLSVAFAIAQTQKYSGDAWGMPTRGSYAFSSTGKRMAWVEEALKRNEGNILEAIREMCFELMTVKIDVLLTKWNAELNKAA
jgi:hypothetical protein